MNCGTCRFWDRLNQTDRAGEVPTAQCLEPELRAAFRPVTSMGWNCNRWALPDYDARTREALAAAIAHWRELVSLDTIEAIQAADTGPYASECALCELFNNPDLDSFDMRCTGCPIADKSGSAFCVGTPFTAASRAWMEVGSDIDGLRHWLGISEAEVGDRRDDALARWRANSAAMLGYLLALQREIES